MRAPFLALFLAAFTVVAGQLGFLAAPGRAEWRVLPAEVPLEGTGLRLELRNAEIVVKIEREAAPKVLATTVSEDESGQVEVSFGEPLVVRRTEDESARIRVEAWIAPGRALEIQGTDVAVRIVDPEVPDLGQAFDPQARGATLLPGAEPFRLVLERSQADLSGLLNVSLEASDSALWLRQTRGRLEAILRGGTAEIRDHRGDADLRSTSAEMSMFDIQGRVKSQLDGGSLEIDGGRGRIEGTGNEALLAVERWTGELVYRGFGGHFQARDTEPFQKAWTVTGDHLAAVMEQIRGPLALELRGGSWTASDLDGAVTVTATGAADLDLNGTDEPVALKLLDGSSARLTALAAVLRAEVQDADLDIDGVERLILTAERSRVVTRDVEHLGKMTAADTDLRLDLTPLTGNAAVDLRGSGHAVVWLPIPCIVRPSPDDARVAEHILVTECDLHLTQQRVRGVRRELIYGARKPVTLTAHLAGEAELTVEGRARD